MEDLISVDALKKEMFSRCIDTDVEIDKGRAKWDSGLWIRYKVFEECVNAAPRIKSSSKYGHWVIDEHGIPYCSECRTHWDAETNYCPYCGVNMNSCKQEVRE